VAVAGDDLPEEVADAVGGAEVMVLGEELVEARLCGGGDRVDVEF
jgi:hypothetical protein